MFLTETKNLRTIFTKNVLYLSFLFLFFVIIEWRWQIELLGISVLNPYPLAAAIGLLIILLQLISFAYPHNNLSLTALFIMSIQLYSFVIFLLNVNELKNIVNVVTLFGAWCINFALFIVASDVFFLNSLNKKKYILCVLYFLFVCAPFVLLLLLGHTEEANYSLRRLLYILEFNDAENHGVSYQSFGLKIAMLSFYMFAITKNKKIIAAILTISLLALYVVGSKAALLGFCFAVVVYLPIILYHSRRFRQLSSYFVVFLIIVLYAGFLIVGNTELQESENWVIQSFSSGSDEGSIHSREAVSEKNVLYRKSNFLLGDYMFDAKLGRPGSATHSALANLEYYGVAIFTLYVGIWCWLLFRLLSYKGKRNFVMHLASLGMLFFTPLIAVAYAGQSYINFMVWGFAAAAIKMMDMEKKSKRKSLYCKIDHVMSKPNVWLHQD